MSWTEERVATLRKLALDGLSAAQIADELACGITRNAVLGKMHRMGIGSKTTSPFANAGTGDKPRQPKPRTSLPKTAPARTFNEHPAEAKPKSAPEPEPVTEEERATLAERANAAAPGSQRVTIMELRESMCRWPLGDPASRDFSYCGADAPIGEGPYCKFHGRIAYQPSQPRKARAR